MSPETAAAPPSSDGATRRGDPNAPAREDRTAPDALEDPRRLAVLREAGLLDSPSEEGFDRLSRLASRLLDVPAAYVSLVDRREYFRNRRGLEGGPDDPDDPGGSNSLCEHVVRSGSALVIPDMREAAIIKDNPALASGNTMAYVGIPLETEDGYVLGSFCVNDDRPREWTEDELETLRELARSATVEIELRRTARRLDREHRRQRFLAEASARLASSLDPQRTLDTVASLAVSEIADLCIVDIVENANEGNRISRLAIAHADPDSESLANGLLSHPPDPESRRLFGRVMRSGRPYVKGKITDRWLRRLLGSNGQYPILRELDARSLAMIPLKAGDLRLGVVTFIRSGDRPAFGPQDVDFAEELTHHASLAVANAHYFQEARRAIRSREEVLGIVSHDLRNPLNTISGAAQLLRTLPHDPEQDLAERKEFGMIERSVDQMNRMIRDLLDITRIEAGRLSVEKAEVPVERVISQAIEAHRQAAEQADVRLEAEVAGRLPAISADMDRILQVIGNLLSNALKFTAAGGSVTLTAECPGKGEGSVDAEGEDSEQAEPDFVWFTVRDTGSGIPAGMLPHLFDRFWQGSANDGRGVGLGLPIVKGIVDAHGGEVGVESAPGEGTTFRFSIPAA